ncbi:class I SAM-dependent methyltransferase [Nocardia sp. NBC_01327]|uniref:class I SAM-dependent methyltransferase n=1 Tax=Nocardia sp. NBC_01327 TaxID=2903593 RepID=UPI002E106470|nr:class I SAM-dependent methyltransferase [Nocardia sp. NBC_01327]
MTEFLDDTRLEQSSVVANSAMNRDRRLPAYRRELGFDPVAWLAARQAPQRWLDIGCGSGHALFEAARSLPRQVQIIGLDLVGYFAGSPCPGIDLVTGSVLTWTPDTQVDLITAVHSLHYIGDKLEALTRMSSWLTTDGQFAANFDASSVRWADGSPIGRRFTTALRGNGFHYDARNRRLTRTGHAIPGWEFRYLGADDHAGPNYTGQDSVSSHYDRS